MRIDARLPVRFGSLDSRRPDEAVLSDSAWAARFDGPPPSAPGHAAGCACCVVRSGAALALAQMFRERAVGSGPPVKGVLVVAGPDGEAAVRQALTVDPFVSSRFRAAEAG